MRLRSDGSTSALASSAPPATKRTIAAATSSVTSLLPGCNTAASACVPVIGASRRRFWVMLGIVLLQALQRRKVVLPQRDQHPIVTAREVKALGRRFVCVELCLEGLGRAVLDQVGKFSDEARGARATELVALRQGKDLFELIEDQQRNERGAGLISQHVIAMVQKLPQRLALDRHPGLGPLARAPRRTQIACLICSAGSGASRL